MTLLTEEEQADALSKFKAGGFVGAKQQLVPKLSNEQLESLGIQSHAVRAALLLGFDEGGPVKTLVVVDRDGTEEELVFNNKKEFNIWMETDGHSLIKLLPNGKKQVVATWERIEDGGRYFTS